MIDDNANCWHGKLHLFTYSDKLHCASVAKLRCDVSSVTGLRGVAWSSANLSSGVKCVWKSSKAFQGILRQLS